MYERIYMQTFKELQERYISFMHFSVCTLYLKTCILTLKLPASWGHSTALLSDHSNILKIHHTGKWTCQALLQKTKSSIQSFQVRNWLYFKF